MVAAAIVFLADATIHRPARNFSRRGRPSEARREAAGNFGPDSFEGRELGQFRRASICAAIAKRQIGRAPKCLGPALPTRPDDSRIQYRCPGAAALRAPCPRSLRREEDASRDSAASVFLFAGGRIAAKPSASVLGAASPPFRGGGAARFRAAGSRDSSTGRAAHRICAHATPGHGVSARFVLELRAGVEQEFSARFGVNRIHHEDDGESVGRRNRFGVFSERFGCGGELRRESFASMVALIFGWCWWFKDAHCVHLRASGAEIFRGKADEPANRDTALIR